MDPEFVHDAVTMVGRILGFCPCLRRATKFFLAYGHPSLEQTILGMHFHNPVGLTAGFDYKALLTRILPAVGFGFGTVGTISNLPCEGNSRPRLGRLPLSRSLLVNKGFRNPGIAAVLSRHAQSRFAIPIGISIGKTNLPRPMTQAEAISDIVSSFRQVEASRASFQYYELNVSCPNLFGNVEFYSPGHLRELLSAVTSLQLTRPVFVKMPISEGDEDVSAMLDVIMGFRVKGVIFGNLQKDRKHPSFVPDEVVSADKGHFSGKPTELRSNELIALARRKCGSALVIIGSGGVFSAEDAYEKIRLGASLVQLATGMIFEGPQLIGEINRGLVRLLERDGYKSISDAVGTATR
ncbi:dihydroorotate dehydrogenase (quinone) [Candidatus Uhrbacteria bacterium RIFOXYC12_FULL_57_11]|nr:MAG: dihydroorotate dehydrogenase (quinone) [Candidatus Uhrbacteria bacterium RIFOXYC12_FULL_57_11]